MQHIPVDFSRVLEPDRVEVGFADSWQLRGFQLREGDRVILHETGLEVEGILYKETRQGQPYWFAIPDWATREDVDVTPDLPQESMP